MRVWAEAVLDLVFPALCPLCGDVLGAGRRDPICGTCWEAFPLLPPGGCVSCGAPGPATLAAGTPASACPACAAEPTPLAFARAAGVYDGRLREAILALKFRGKRALAHPLGDLVAARCAEAFGAIDALVPVPLARRRERERGFNQAELIAARLGRRLGIPARPRWLGRARSTEPQSELDAAARRRNVRDAFLAAPAVAGRSIVVIDDVLTTGATVRECARTLRRAGARSVGVVTVARVV
jgi:ComF family protein